MRVTPHLSLHDIMYWFDQRYISSRLMGQRKDMDSSHVHHGP